MKEFFFKHMVTLAPWTLHVRAHTRTHTHTYLQSTPGRLSAVHQKPQRHQSKDHAAVAVRDTAKDNPSVHNRAAFISPPLETH